MVRLPIFFRFRRLFSWFDGKGGGWSGSKAASLATGLLKGITSGLAGRAVVGALSFVPVVGPAIGFGLAVYSAVELARNWDAVSDTIGRVAGGRANEADFEALGVMVGGIVAGGKVRALGRRAGGGYGATKAEGALPALADSTQRRLSGGSSAH